MTDSTITAPLVLDAVGAVSDAVDVANDSKQPIMSQESCPEITIDNWKNLAIASDSEECELIESLLKAAASANIGAAADEKHRLDASSGSPPDRMTQYDISRLFVEVNSEQKMQDAILKLHDDINEEFWWWCSRVGKELLRDGHVIASWLLFPGFAAKGCALTRLCHCSKIRGLFFPDLERLIPDMIVLNCYGTSVDDAAVQSLQHKTLITLDLTWCDMIKDFKTLFQSLDSKLPALETLTLASTFVDDDALLELKHSTVKSLDLTSCQHISAKSLLDIHTRCPQLNKLTLYHSALGDDAMALAELRDATDAAGIEMLISENAAAAANGDDDAAAAGSDGGSRCVVM
jgi:hypothetical protein